MKTLNAVACLVAVALLLVAAPLLAAIQLTPVVSGLSGPLFVTHAGDGSNRLFIVERGGVIKVLQPGASAPTVFLDINPLVVDAGGEQGLLGLAFHPDYESNGRFFVYYTGAGGVLTIAEYRVSGNPNVASTTARVILTIPHPGQTNHNGGMLAFGPDEYLYIGVGDGGGANDGPNNAQDLGELLGKILRIDIDVPAGSQGPYLIPASNPFVGSPGARAEIFAYGMRNPWRFSFDRGTNEMWVADVGQGAREEVDTPIVSGGNYGWRVYEGFNCTTNDPQLCGASGLIPPLFDYSHVNGRCSITGGYVYRGAQGALADGTYVYGDFCSGEIFTWTGSASVLLDTSLNISSFGEDESGELYVVGLGGTVSRIVSLGPPACTYAIAPTSQGFGAGGGAGGVAVTAGPGCGWTAAANASWIHVTGGQSGTGNGNVSYSVDANTSAAQRTGAMTIAGLTFTVSEAGAAAPSPSPSCAYSISPTQASFSRNGGASRISVVTGAGCAWTAISGEPWITITSGARGRGNGTVGYSVAPGKGVGTRNGKLKVAGITFTVKRSK